MADIRKTGREVPKRRWSKSPVAFSSFQAHVVFGIGPDLLALERNRVLVGRAGLEARDPHQGVVVPLDAEGARAVEGSLDAHFDLAGGVSLDPAGGVGGTDVAQEWAEDEVRRHA